MARKFELHLDALIVIVLLFVSAIAFIAFQRHQYSVLWDDNMGRQMKQLSLEMEIARLEQLLKQVGIVEQRAGDAPKDAVEKGLKGR